jgi:hypothetical protein
MTTISEYGHAMLTSCDIIQNVIVPDRRKRAQPAPSIQSCETAKVQMYEMCKEI